MLWFIKFVPGFPWPKPVLRHYGTETDEYLVNFHQIEIRFSWVIRLVGWVGRLCDLLSTCLTLEILFHVCDGSWCGGLWIQNYCGKYKTWQLGVAFGDHLQWPCYGVCKYDGGRVKACLFPSGCCLVLWLSCWIHVQWTDPSPILMDPYATWSSLGPAASEMVWW